MQGASATLAQRDDFEHRAPDVAIYVVRPPGPAPRKVTVLTELIIERLGKR